MDLTRVMNHEITLEYKGYSNVTIKQQRTPEVQKAIDEYFAKGGKINRCLTRDLSPLTPSSQVLESLT